MAETYVIMQIDLISGEKEPIGVCDDLEYAVQIVEDSNARIKLYPYSKDSYAHVRSGTISDFNKHFWYIKHVPRVMPG